MNKIINKNKENVNKLVEEVIETFNKPKQKTNHTSTKFPREHKENKKLYECSQSIFTTILQHKQNNKLKKNLSFFACHSKFCSICNQVKSKKWARELFKVSTLLQKEQEQRFLFLTLTIKNMKISELDLTIKEMNKKWKKLWERYLSKQFNGFVKILEITFPNGDMAHPHFHILLTANKNYFYKSNIDYLKTEDISNLWKRVLKVDYQPIVDIRIIKPKKDKQGNRILKEALPAVISEMLKYPMKDTDYNKLNQETMVELYSNLYRKRLIATGGNLKMSINKNDNQELEIEKEDMEDYEKIAYIVMKYLKGGYVVAGGDYYK